MEKVSENLSKYLTPQAVWALTFGCCIGWGSFIMPGTTFLPTAGPVGTIIAIFSSSILILIIAANYHFMTNKFPDCGGAFTFTKKIFGYDHAFLCAWCLWVAYIALLWANATAFVLIGRNVLGNFFQVGFHYKIFTHDIYFGEIIFTLFILAIFTFLSLRKKIFVSRLNIFLATFFLGAGLILVSAAFGETEGVKIFSPAFSDTKSPPVQIFKIVAFAPWAFMGFEIVSHAADEINFSPKKSFKIMAAAIISAAIFYSAMTILAVTSVPDNFFNWQKYVDNLYRLEGLEALPTFNATFQHFGSAGIYLLTLIALATLSTSLIGYFFVTSRLTYAVAKENLLPEKFKILNAEKIPEKIILFLFAISIFIPFIGRTAIVWLTDVTTVGATVAYAYTSACAYITAKKVGDAKYKITGVLGVIFSVAFALLLLVPNLIAPSFWEQASLTTESYFLLVVCSILGFAYFKRIFSKDKLNRFGKNIIVWIAMLFAIFFSSLMWMRQSTDENIRRVVENISEFYEGELERFGVKLYAYRQMQEENYLKIQMSEVRATLFVGSAIQMILILFSLFIMFSIYSTISRREKSAELARIQAEENSKAKSQFLSNMSHDIRTPMNAILGYTKLARQENVSAEEIQNFLAKIESSGQHLLELINDVLEMSRIESGKLELNISETDLKKILSNLRDMFSTQMSTKNINFVVESEAENNFVFCDAQKLNRILLNLTSNAYKFTPAGGEIKISLREKKTVENFGSYELRVKDSGIGMTAEFAATVFEPFTRERTSTVSKIQGTGLGMAITKNFVDLMNGKISVETAPNKGTEFILNFQFKLAEEKFSELEVEEEKNSAVDFAQKKLLLVDDIEVNREIAKMLLEQSGFEVETAVNGADAVEKFSAAEEFFDAVLMDIQMPVMNGYEATKKIRSFNKKIPIIAMTANAFSEDVENAKAAGMNGHIAKPIDVNKMLETLSDVLK